MDAADPFKLSRFVEAQESVYSRASEEIRAGRKQSHWMWFVFPQIAGLGVSAVSRHYAITSLDEARAYLAHAVLGPRLVGICEAALAVQGRSAREIFGSPDDMKLRSCATLFAAISGSGSVFHRILDQYFSSEPDPQTLLRIAPD